MATPLTEIPVPPQFTGDCADFYRRGWRDGELGAPKDMKGYPADLQLAYVTGGLAGSLAARPPKSAGVKVHTNIGHERSLCGLAPTKGKYQILAIDAFFAAADADQCAVCLERLAKRGYSINRLRARYRAEHQQPSLPLAA